MYVSPIRKQKQFRVYLKLFPHPFLLSNQHNISIISSLLNCLLNQFKYCKQLASSTYTYHNHVGIDFNAKRLSKQGSLSCSFRPRIHFSEHRFVWANFALSETYTPTELRTEKSSGSVGFGVIRI